MAAFLKCSVETFTRRYTRLRADRRGLELVDRKDRTDGSCVFLQPTGRCRVHRVKPKQCRDFPRTWRFRGYRAICAGARHA
jgi:Fe-S-cluster containining protein